MTSFLKDAVSWLRGVLKENASLSVTYTRGTHVLTGLVAEADMSLLRHTDAAGGVTVERTDKDFLIDAADLVLPGIGTASASASPSIAANVSAGGEPWGDPANVLSSDDAYATANLDGNQSDELRVTGFGFSVPGSATVLGIEVRVERRMVTEGGEITDLDVRLRKAAGAAGDNKASAAVWPTTEAVATYGGSADLWGAAWSPADVNDAGFGVSVRAQGALNPMTAMIDHVGVTVYYSAAAVTRPKVDDTIACVEAGVTSTYRVLPYGNDEPCWHWEDPYHTIIRIRAKLVGEVP